MTAHHAAADPFPLADAAIAAARCRSVLTPATLRSLNLAVPCPRHEAWSLPNISALIRLPLRFLAGQDGPVSGGYRHQR